MTTIGDVRADIARIINSNLDGWRAQAYVGDQINTHTIVVARPGFDPRLVFALAKTEYVFRLTAYVDRVAGAAGEGVLDDLCEIAGNGSLIARIQNGSLWSVTVDYAQVEFVGETVATMYGTDSLEYLCVPFDVKVVW